MNLEKYLPRLTALALLAVVLLVLLRR